MVRLLASQKYSSRKLPFHEFCSKSFIACFSHVTQRQVFSFEGDDRSYPSDAPV
jgi:hypothetical protein